MNKTIAGVASTGLIALALGLGASPAMAGGDKVDLCHATGSVSNPYVPITVSTNAFFSAGHVNHVGDIYPEFQFTDNKGEVVTVPASNWGLTDTGFLGEVIFNAGCAIPVVEQPQPTTPPATETPTNPPVTGTPTTPPAPEPSPTPTTPTEPLPETGAGQILLLGAGALGLLGLGAASMVAGRSKGSH